MANKELLIKIAADSREAVQALNRIDQSARQTSTVMGRLDTAVKGAVAAFGTTAVVDFARDALRASSDLEQSFGALESVFGDAADEVARFGAQSADSVGLSQAAYQQFAATTGAQLQNLLGPQADVVQQTDELIRLGADLAATYGGEVSDAVAAIGSLFRGEADPIERYAVSIKQSDVNARLAAEGLADLEGEARKQAEAQARLALLFEQTANAQGQFARESDTLAGAQARAAAEVENLKAQIGQELQPAMLALLKTVRDLGPEVASTATDVAELVGQLAPLIEAVTTVTGAWTGFLDELDALSNSGNGVLRFLGAAFDELTKWANPLEIIKDALIDIKVLMGDVVKLSGQLPKATGLSGGVSGGGGGGGGGLIAFDSGGIVPGPRGAPRVVLAHGGETILPTHKGPVGIGQSSMQPIVIQIDGQTLMNALAPVAQRYTNRTGRAVFG